MCLAYELQRCSRGHGDDDGIDSNGKYFEFSYQLLMKQPNTCEFVARALFLSPDSNMPQTQMHCRTLTSQRPPYCFFRSSHETQPKRKKKNDDFFSSFVSLWVVVVFLCRNNFSHNCDTSKTFLGDGNKNGIQFSTKINNIDGVVVCSNYLIKLMEIIE